jgi:5-methylcytosine-specific restriction endonuclease McrA
MAGTIGTRAYQAFRESMKSSWRAQNAPCGICGQRTIRYDGPKNEPDSFEMDHKISRKRAHLMGRPELDLDPNNVQASHVRCNRNKSAGDPTPDLGELDEDW